jgi:hypothetical protein
MQEGLIDIGYKEENMGTIYYQNQDELTGRFVIVDEDGNSIWAYLTIPFEEQIDKDCFLGSRRRVDIDSFDHSEYRRKQIPLPITNEFSID